MGNTLVNRPRISNIGQTALIESASGFVGGARRFVNETTKSICNAVGMESTGRELARPRYVVIMNGKQKDTKFPRDAYISAPYTSIELQNLEPGTTVQSGGSITVENADGCQFLSLKDGHFRDVHNSKIKAGNNVDLSMSNNNQVGGGESVEISGNSKNNTIRIPTNPVNVRINEGACGTKVNIEGNLDDHGYGTVVQPITVVRPITIKGNAEANKKIAS